jgi:hypothetical protein
MLAPPTVTVSDAAKRISETAGRAVVDGYVGYWMAFRISDGRSDGVHYWDRADAIRHQLHERQCAYMRLLPTGCPPSEAEVWLQAVRRIYDAGFRITHESDPHPVTPLPGLWH